MKKWNFVLCFILILSTLLSGQDFKLIGDSPFGIQAFNSIDSSRASFECVFFDEDGDEDMDLYHIGIESTDSVINSISDLSYFIEFQENIGNKWNPSFGPREKLFEDFPFPNGDNFFIPTCGDLNGDHKIDFVICSEVDSIYQQYPLFYLSNPNNSYDISNCSLFNLPPFPPNSIPIPSLTDLDNDGDLDLLISIALSMFFPEDEEEILIYYARNMGSQTNPDFVGWKSFPYDIYKENAIQFISSGDIDLDGDVDLLNIVLSTPSRINVIKNIAAPGDIPSFQNPVESPFGLPTPINEDDLYFLPSLVDIDNDGDLDLFLIRNLTIVHEDEEVEDETYFTLDYYENKLISNDEVTYLSSKLSIYPNPGQGKFHLLNNTEQKIKSIEIFDLSGKLLEISYELDKNTFELNGFEIGIYLIKINLEEKSIVKKLIIS